MPVATNGNRARAQEVVLITGAGGWLGGVLAQVIRRDSAYTDAQLILADIGTSTCQKLSFTLMVLNTILQSNPKLPKESPRMTT